MNVMELVRESMEQLNAAGAEQRNRYFKLPPSQLYKLCTELQYTTLIDSSEYRDLDNCKRALANENWEIARVAMPHSLFGMELQLLV